MPSLFKSHRAKANSAYVMRTSKQKGLQRSHCNPIIFLAGQEGFEPPSLGFGVRCSNRWSYWPAGTTYIAISPPHVKAKLVKGSAAREGRRHAFQ